MTLHIQFNVNKLILQHTCTHVSLQVWDFKHGQCKLTLHGHEGAVSCLQFDDNRIISGALDRLIKIWNLTTGQVGKPIMFYVMFKLNNNKSAKKNNNKSAKKSEECGQKCKEAKD